MRSSLLALLLACSALTPLDAAEFAAASKVDAVTVFPRGAEIERIVELRLDAGEHIVLLRDLPSDVVAGSVRVEGKADGRIEIGSVDTRREFVLLGDPEALKTRRQRLEAEIESLQDEQRRIEGAVKSAEFQRTLIQKLTELQVAPRGKEGEKPAATGDLGPLLDLVGQRLAALETALFDARLKQRELGRKVEDLRKQLSAEPPQRAERTLVAIHLAAPQPVAGGLRVRYQVAQAAWTPAYDARLETGAGGAAARLELVQRAEVTQRTGEAWDGIELTLSTARPAGATAAPELNPQRVDPVQIHVQESAADEARRRQAPVTMAPSPTPVAPMAGAPVPMAARSEQAVAQREAETANAGFHALYRIPGRVVVANTGETKKVRIATSILAPKLGVRAVPKLDPTAYLHALFTLQGESPLLPGGVALFRDGTFVGNGGLPLLAPGQEHELGFGADDKVKVERKEVKRVQAEVGIISGSRTDTQQYVLTIRNHHNAAMPVTVLDQAPFSEEREIKVELLANTTAPSEKDFERRRGILAWRFDLEPGKEREIKLGYKVTWPKDMEINLSMQ